MGHGNGLRRVLRVIVCAEDEDEDGDESMDDAAPAAAAELPGAGPAAPAAAVAPGADGEEMVVQVSHVQALILY